MRTITKLMSALTVGVAMFLMSSCGSDTKSGPFGEVAELYAQIADNNVKMMEKLNEMNSVKGGISESAQKAASALMKSTLDKNKALSEKAKALAEAMNGMAVEAEASEASGLQVDGGTVRLLEASDNGVRFVVEIPYEGVTERPVYCLLLDGECNVVSRTLAGLVDGKVAVNLNAWSSNEKDAAFNRNVIAKVAKIQIVAKHEYEKGAVSSAPSEDEEQAEELIEADGEMIDGPDTTLGEMAGDGEVVTVDGVQIAKGLPLVETLKKLPASKLSWGYSEDYGLGVVVGNVWILIPDEQVTKKGMEIIDNYDGMDDIQFALDYISPNAKIEEFQIQ